jgi:hypothetical protein
VLLAYLDEIGETGAFVSRDDRRYNTSPAFGYAGFVIDANKARSFGHIFYEEKRALYRNELAAAAHPSRWERKGSDIFRTKTHEDLPHQIRVVNGLVQQCLQLGGRLFYYVDEKPIGTPHQTRLERPEQVEREAAAMRETLNRVARHAQRCKSNVMVMLDQVTEKTRAERLPVMYGHVFGRAADFPEMRRIIEPPMHVDSALSSNIQFADWIAAGITRALDYQLLDPSPYGWVTTSGTMSHFRDDDTFTYESKAHLHQRAITDLHRATIFRPTRRLYPKPSGQLLGERVDPSAAARMRGIAEAAQRRR